MIIDIISSICTAGFTIEVRAVPGTEFALEFFAAGVGGHHVRGSLHGVVSEGGSCAAFREAPFSVLEVGIINLWLGEGAANRAAALSDEAVDHRFAIDDPFEGDRVPDGPVSIGGVEK